MPDYQRLKQYVTSINADLALWRAAAAAEVRARRLAFVKARAVRLAERRRRGDA